MTKHSETRFSFGRKCGVPQELLQNQYGQTVLGSDDKEDLEIDKVDFTVDSEYGLQAGISILNSTRQVLYNWLEAMKDEPDDNPQKKALLEQLHILELEDQKSSSSSNDSSLDQPPTDEFIDMITGVSGEHIFDSSEDDIYDLADEQDIWQAPDRVKKFITVHDDEQEEDVVYRKTTPKSFTPMTMAASDTFCIKCGLSMPNNAKFCPDCGSGQVVKHCPECGFKFKSTEKFCPECGTHRS